MPHILADRLTIEFPLYHVGARSLKKRLIAASRLRQDDSNRIVVAALRDLSFAIAPGERVALVGNNGAGKTTLLRTLAGVYEPVGGRLEVAGMIGSLIDPAAGMDAESTGRENIVLRGLFRGMNEAECNAMADEVGQFSGLGEFLDVPVRTYSAGMSVRLAFAVATLMEPEILLMDEWFLAGDADFMQRARARLEQLVRKAEILVLATHDMNIVREWCTRAIRLEGGRVVMDGTIEEVLGLAPGGGLGQRGLGPAAGALPPLEMTASAWRGAREADATAAATAAVPDYRVYHQAMAASHVDIRDKRVLVVGCGNGTDCIYLSRLGAAEVVGVDDIAEVGAGFSNPRVRYLRASLTDIPLEAGGFDLVFSLYALQHVDDLPKAFAEMGRLTAPGGVLYSAAGPLWCSRGGPLWGDAFDHDPWPHLRMPPEEIAALGETARAAGRDSQFYTPAVLRRHLETTRFNRRRAHEYVDAFLALDGIEVIRNDIEQEPVSRGDSAIVRALIAQGYSAYDLFGFAHLAIGRRRADR